MPNDAVQEIKDKLDIVEIIRSYIPLMPAGKNFKAVCPFHKEKTPSFIVSPDRQSWHCFGSCNEGGDVISFVMKYEQVEFYEALKALAEKAGVELKQFNPQQEKEFGVLYDIHEAAVKFYEDQLAQSEEAKFYLKQRGIHDDTREEFSIGFAPNAKDALMVHLINTGYAATDIERAGLAFKTDRGTYMDRFRGRVMFPLKNTFGKTVSFSGRILPNLETDNVGKYINGPETPIFSKSRILYALDKAKQEIKKLEYAAIVEGQMDLVTLYQEGVRNVVATSGTALTNTHLQTLRKITDRIVLAFDTDEAGKLAAERTLDMAHMLDFTARLFFVPDGKDASEYIAKNPGKIKGVIERMQLTPFQFYHDRFFLDQFKNDIKRATRAFLQKTLMLASPIDQNTWIQQLAAKTRIPEQVLYEELQLIKKTRSGKTEPQTAQAVEEAPTSRIEKIARRIALVCTAYPSLRNEIEPYTAYFPKSAFDQKTKDLLEMQSSLEVTGDEETSSNEIKFLLHELKSEYLKAKQQKLVIRMKEAQTEGKPEESSRLLKEFDELTKLREND
ncbi:DNA primase [Candidatus Wolfebacteria bacterium RIFCSPHIGHO2_01_FULL_48_22]|uniref:DNA primase n=2 Tax=Candidatus Wolfeibacteriota TaxID=1752735 RepID=A0A1F8DQQ2_9BACT|nr:MAG: DNA primase [Candidatus Wolfebacteria bacterium RIFCSPHIGHO2_01_FULL_48_22]OGM92001.1 MAG: DNA primase [Candidatus Wolfebacteria bacterium RIFCSPLOWO2_01_FULL_47_17b]